MAASWKRLIHRHPQWHGRLKYLLSALRHPWCRLRGKPPALIPRSLRGAFAMNGKVEILYAYVDASRPAPLRYDAAAIARAGQRVAAGELGHYGGVDAWLYAALQRHPIRGQRVAVMGSADQGFGPWYECVCLQHQAEPTAIDYNPVEYADNRIRFLPAPVDPAAVPPFAAALSISSFEHDGLGRYGDPLDPDADLKAMQLMKRLLQPGGRLYLTVPLGRDKLVFNIHRIYGRARLPRLLAGWTVVETFGFDEACLDRDTGFGWNPTGYERGPGGWTARPLHPGYPEYAPVWVLRNDPA